MGTLFNQEARKTLTVDILDIESELLELNKIANKLQITLDQAIKVREILEIKRRNNLAVHNGDIFDEQMSGFGELLKEYLEKK